MPTSAAALSVVPPGPEELGPQLTFGPLPKSVVYERVLQELAIRITAVHEALMRRGDVLRFLPEDRSLTEEEAGDLAWRVYTLACAIGASLVRCPPHLVLLAAEWRASPQPRAWEALCERQF